MTTETTAYVPPDRVLNRGFIAMLVTLAGGAFNDNVYRGSLLLAVATGGFWADKLGPGGTGWITAMLYAPFVVLLGLTGLLADRRPKRGIIICTRIAEMMLAIAVIWAMWAENLVFACILLILLASQSAFFSPAKYGMVPELVSDRHLSRANGILSLLTNISIICGLGVAGFLLELGDQTRFSGPMLVGVVMFVVAGVSLVASIQLPRCPAAQADLQPSVNTFRIYWQSLRIIRGTPLASATFAWCMFYAVGSLLITIMPYYKETLGISDLDVSALMGSIVVGIAVGGIAAGLGSGDRIRASLVPIGAGGLALTLLILSMVGTSFGIVAGLLIVTGCFAGLFVVPILAILQHAPVPGFRSRCVGTANFMTFMAMTITAVTFAVMATFIGSDPATWLLISGVLMIAVTGFLLAVRSRLVAVAAPESSGTIG